MILAILALMWSPTWGDGTPQEWVNTACANESFNGVKYQPYLSEPENVTVFVERRGNVVRVEVWNLKPRQLVEAAEARCNNV